MSIIRTEFARFRWESARLKSSLGNFSFSAQYQQCPVPVQGEIIKWEWFRFYDEPAAAQPGDVIVQSWDTACKAGERNDYSVCTTWLARGNVYFLLDVFRERLTYPDLRQRMIDLQRAWNAESVLIEDRSSGTSLLDDLCCDDEVKFSPMSVEPVGDKVLRMHTSSRAIESGRVHLPIRAPWLDAFRAELLQFPKGRYDDQVDSLSQFLDWADRTEAGTASVVTFL